MRKALVVAAILLVVGCFLAYARLVYARLAYDFVTLPENSQILYEAGAEDLAKLAAAELALGMSKVERRQCLPFNSRQLIKIYIFNDRNHYANFSNAPAITWGSSTTDEIYLSEKLRERISTLPNILIHELSHVHIRQYVGTFKYIKDIPGWFLEGLAVSVSSGGGAGDITAEEAQTALENGNRFEPDDSGSIIGPKTAHNYGLEPKMYYRQAGLFVDYLQKTNPHAFEAALVGVLNGASFREVWPMHYGRTIADLWQSFEKSIRA